MVAIWDTASFSQLWVVQGMESFPLGSLPFRSGYAYVTIHPQDAGLLLIGLHGDAAQRGNAHVWGLFSTERMRIVQVS